MARQCTFEDCRKKHDSHGYCSVHAFQFRKYGHPLTREEKHRHLSDAAKKKKQTLGKRWTLSEEKKSKKGVALNTGRTHFKKGQKAWNKGTRGLMGAWNKGRKLSPEHVEKLRQCNIGRRPWNKVGDGITAQTKLERAKFRATMVDIVFARDNYTCLFCDQYSGHLHVDHIKAWADYPELRFELENCRTLCRACHYYITFKRKMPIDSRWGLTTMTRKEG